MKYFMTFQTVRRLKRTVRPQLLPLPRPPRGDQEHWHMSLLRPELHEEQAADEPCLSHEAAQWEINNNVKKQLKIYDVMC